MVLAVNDDFNLRLTDDFFDFGSNDQLLREANGVADKLAKNG